MLVKCPNCDSKFFSAHIVIHGKHDGSTYVELYCSKCSNGKSVVMFTIDLEQEFNRSIDTVTQP